MDKKTLAEFISTTRETLGLSQTGLAKKANIDIFELEAIESGQDLFLSSTTRQKLANALKIRSSKIKELEKHLKLDFDKEIPIEEIKNRILYKEKNLKCPICQNELKTRIETMYDLEDNPVYHPKAICTKCVFQIK
jgi:transcriptional regulator with XRE-family HTH domain